MATGEITAHTTWDSAPRRPQLSEEQKRLVLGAAAEWVAGAASSRGSVAVDPALGGAGEITLSGAFVSLKRAKHLRSCCGMLGTPIPLAMAVHDAAIRTAREDVRFPPVSPSELAYLDLEVWLLFAPEPMAARGDDRIQAVEVGRHGLQVVRGQARGLLLPGVPVENGWDSKRFLEQVCVKAGLHPALWRDDDTQLFTFEGEAIRGRVAAAAHGAAEVPIPFLPDQVAAYADSCRSNIVALLTGATPSYYFFGAPDGNVSGIVASVRWTDRAEDLTFSHLSLRPGVPLQSTLFTLAQSAAQALARQGIRPKDLASLHVGLMLLYDPAMHGTVDDLDIQGIQPARRAVLVTERGNSSILYDHQKSASDLVREAASQARVANPQHSPVFSLGALSTMDRVVVTNVPKPVRGPASRDPGVAGTFYPAQASELERLVDEMLHGKASAGAWPAAMVPHAGLIYSGRIAADVLKRIQLPETIIVIGPKHTPLGVEWAVAPQQTWSMPGFSIESDPKLARQLSAAIPGLELDALAHQREHAIEVELPFIARLAPQSKVVGIAIGGGDFARCSQFAEGLAGVLRERSDKPLLLISSDMNHFATDAENRRLDEVALAAMQTLDPQNLYDTVTENRISMCGVLPAVIVFQTLQLLGGLSESVRVGYATTADVTGDKSRVVGYAGMLFR
jgi:AmmeMemoRadiSam system protein B/AmmeMemoRadiSam system protein A